MGSKQNPCPNPNYIAVKHNAFIETVNSSLYICICICGLDTVISPVFIVSATPKGKAEIRLFFNPRGVKNEPKWTSPCGLPPVDIYTYTVCAPARTNVMQNVNRS